MPTATKKGPKKGSKSIAKSDEQVRKENRAKFNEKLASMSKKNRERVKQFLKTHRRKKLNYKGVINDPKFHVEVYRMLRHGMTYREIEVRFNMLSRNGMTTYDAINKPAGIKALKSAGVKVSKKTAKA